MMSSGSPRARINQFFASKKKQSEKGPKTSFSGSPKGTLVRYLVKSPDANTHPDPENASSRPGSVKRNLTLEIGLGSDIAKKCSLPSLESTGDSRKDEGLCNDKKRAHFETLIARDVISADAPSKEEGGSESGGGNLELKKFANDFLSLYCSDLQSALPETSEARGKKRDGSSFFLSTCSKKQCITDTFDGRPDTSNNASEESGCNDLKEINMADTSHVSSIRCSKTPDLTLIKSGLTALASSVGTPKSASRSSRLSPGEEFWNEAIQVADGLIVPVERLLANSLVSTSDGSLKTFVKDALSCVAHQNSEYISKLEIVKEEAQNGVGISFMKPNELITEEIKMPPAVIQKNEVSPLPIRHFDFIHEENDTNKNFDKGFLDRANSVSNAGAGLIVGDFINDKKLHDKSCESEAYRKAFDTNQNPSNAHLLDGKLHKPVPDASNSVGITGKSVSLGQVNGANPSCNDLSSIRSISALQERIDAEMLETRSNAQAYHEENNTPASSVPLRDYLQLSSWLPSELVGVYSKKGITKLYPWQVDCLRVDGVLERRNLVYCASTSAGKSFVAEILMLRRVIATGKMALLVLPYVSICAEKAEHLELLLQPLGKHVRSFYGNQGGGSLPKDTSVAVCTIEKANSLINRLLEEGRLSEVGIIVIDELHMVGDQHRGYLLELMLTKLRYAAGEGISESCSEEGSTTSSGKTDVACGLQIVGMSATMPNLAAVADWLQAALYQTNFRPVPLEEFIKVGNTIFNKKMDAVRVLPKTADLGGKDPDHIVELCNEVVQEGQSVLLFCSSRKGCEITARHISMFLKGYSISMRVVDCEYKDYSSAVEALRRCPSGLDPILEETLPSGVAYHHAGLTVEEREIIEMCYRKGIVRVLTATSTLAAGVNLPARRVIFRQPRIGRDFIDGTRYRQMAGRAGRTGIDTKGESILICKHDETKKVSAILNDSCPPLQSCLSEEKNGMTHAIMEVVSGGIVQSASDIHRYVRCTLLNSTRPFEDVVASAQDSLRWLCRKKFLEWNEETGLYSSTPLGRASFGSSLSPEESLVVLNDLSRAREGFVLASDLHLVYLVTPINVEVEPDWELYYQRFMELSPLDQSVGNRVGVVEPFLMRMAHGAPMPVQDRSKGKKRSPKGNLNARSATNVSDLLSNEQSLRIARRFFVALMLSRLVQEVPVSDVCEAFKVARGMIQALQENAGRFASMVSLFCERLGWHDLEGLVAKFQNRVSFGVRAEIVELTTIPYVKGSRARALYKAGLRTPLSIAEASISDIANALFESSSWSGQEGLAKKRIRMGVAKKIKNASRKILLDKAEEASVAAFSAFKSLGINIPQISRPMLSKIAESFEHGSTTSKSAESLFDRSTSQDRKATRYPAEDNKIMVLDNSSEEIVVQKLSKKKDGTMLTTGEMRHNHNMDKALVKFNSDQLLDNLVKPMGASSPTLGPANEVHIVKHDSDNKEKDMEQTLTIHSNARRFDKGPSCASTFPGGFDSFLEQWDLKREFYFDLHYSKLPDQNSSLRFEVFGLAICWENSPIYYVNFLRDFLPCKMESSYHDELTNREGGIIKNLASFDIWSFAKSRWEKLGKIVSKNGSRKLCWNLKTQIQVLKFPCISLQRFNRLGLELKMLNDTELIGSSYILLPTISVHDGIDLCLMTWSLWPDDESKSAPSLEKLAKKRLSSQAAAAANQDGKWRNQMRKAAHDGCCRRVAQIRALSSVVWKLVVSENLVNVLSRIENPMVKVLADMELWGVGVDMEACLRARHVLMRKLKELEKDAHNLAGMPFSLYSTADIAHVLYTRLKLPIPNNSKKGKLHPSTNKHSLDLLRGQHPIISVIKEHRTLAKLLNCTLGSICSRARLCGNSQKYILQGRWLQTSTATGRLSMEEPNLQCVEHMVIFTTHDPDAKNLCSSDIDHHQINPRDFVIPTQENWLLLTADYSQIELRLMAHFSKDSSLVELLRKPDGDCFTMIAARWTGKMESSISSLEREHTKRLVYGILYGMGPNSLAEQLECSPREADEKIHNFKASFPGVSAWLNAAVASCCDKGYVETLMGRKRFLSKINFGNNKEKTKAQRQAVNSICQGSAADVIKVAMIKIHTTIVEGIYLPDADSRFEVQFSVLRGQCRIILQVHDELVLEVDPRFVREAAILLQTSMEGAASLSVPLRVKMKIGRTWGTQEPFLLDS
ncbi:helicase and polymerase-containing protein TEBICHI isoform X1 [Dendrobium catenatum]|uniref:DEAD-box ATP-dependent RNA helicase ISE2, chloroplastic n=1 Tax=Dendrobium catenatum TaxID=906689 RepID=A0A2I0VF51_9ASPA|nr:helicase and polymerase-containing protein TEBICHI isoform X1 [Dendrobium catenatum]XP_020695451.1 helicase and polymerase-containing protein TEBICHI isoform X1 [Dendrobium catenatum]XP_020695452.1 helicase and polymerase-containing protein TEBICHI isoform X1 [Dendrobium catenatum]PKU62051.1 DEAD-box ATP-dependent RNA helicase ISE2, chloroplastic [Dendrobium catenatum]